MLKEQLFIVELVPASFLETELFSPPSLSFVQQIKIKVRVTPWVCNFT